jgi:hypothetical protein
VKPAVFGSSVTITYTRPDTVTISHTATSDATGNYTDTLTGAETSPAQAQGIWTAQAHFAGDGTRDPSDSPACQFVVHQP